MAKVRKGCTNQRYITEKRGDDFVRDIREFENQNLEKTEGKLTLLILTFRLQGETLPRQFCGTTFREAHANLNKGFQTKCDDFPRGL